MFGSRKATGKHLDEEALDQEQEHGQVQVLEPEPDREPEPELTAEERERAEIDEACHALVREGGARPLQPFTPAAPAMTPQTAGEIAAAPPDAEVIGQLDEARREAAEHRAALANAEQQIDALRAELDAARAQPPATALEDLPAPAPDPEVLDQLERSRREAVEYRDALAESERQVAALRADLTAAQSGAQADEGHHQVARADAEAKVTALTAELEKVQASVSESAAEFELVVSELRETRFRLDELAADRDRLSRDLAEALRVAERAQSEVPAKVEALRQTLEEQRAAYEGELARAREREARQAAAADEARAEVLLRQAEIDDLQQRLLESEQQRAEEAASLLAVLEAQQRGAPGSGGWLD